MNPPHNELFMAACGVFGRWALNISRPDAPPAEHAFEKPFALVGGRADNCLCLADPQVSRRHAYFQALPGGVFCVDLGSRAGLRFDGAEHAAGWLRPGGRLQIGPFTAELVPSRYAGWAAAPSWAQDNPLTDRADEAAPLVPVVGEVREDGVLRARWRMSRVLATVGRSTRCQVFIGDPTLSRCHCSFVRTPLGLWVIDLLSREGTVLNGRPVRCERVREGDELKLGRFHVRFWFHPKRRAAAAAPPPVSPSAGAARGAVPPPAASAQVPAADRLLPAVEAAPQAAPALPPERALTLGAARNKQTVFAALAESGGADGGVLMQLVNQFNQMQQEMYDQFQERLLMATRLFATLHQEQSAVVRQELHHLGSIAAELRALQNELARGAGPLPAAGGGAPFPAATREDDEAGPLAAAAPESEDVHGWLNQRISALQDEQETRWHKLLGMILGS
jgi:pSer/pThr/pTyr-binding forkhead associated (FHA) protein